MNKILNKLKKKVVYHYIGADGKTIFTSAYGNKNYILTYKAKERIKGCNVFFSKTPAILLIFIKKMFYWLYKLLI